MTAIVGFTVVIGRRPQPQTACPVVLRPGASGRAPVVRRQGTVVRPAQPWMPAVHALLRHFEASAARAPRVYSEGNEVLSFVDGESVHPSRLVGRRYSCARCATASAHDAAETFSATDDMIWQPWFTRQTGPGTIIGHGDTGTWTVLSDADGIPIAFIDWEYAGPVERIDEVAQTASERAAP
jgi:hypothetical protein